MQFIAEYVFECLGGIALAIGMVLLLANGKQMAQKYMQVKNLLLESKVVYEEDSVKENLEEIRKEELLAMLMTELSYPISLDGTILTKESHNPRFFLYSNLAPVYKKQYIHDKDGTIKQVIYTRK